MQHLQRPGERWLAELKARFAIDVAGMVAGVRARLDGRLALAPLAVEPDLAAHRGRFGLGEIRSLAFSAGPLRKIVLSELHLWPVIEGFALTLRPRPDVAAPTFAADLLLLPTRLAANAEVYGPPPLARGQLAPLASTFARLGGVPGPAWAATIASGEGLHARVGPRLVDELYAALVGALGRYLELLEAAPARAGAAPEDRAFFAAFHEHGPRRGPLRWIFGQSWADRYSRLVFE